MGRRYIPPFAPLRSSTLSVSTGPSSPKSPITIKPRKFKATKKRRNASTPDHRSAKLADYIPTEDPMPWQWVCHRCHTRWPLGVSRRCLHDGHYFCGGITVNPITGKTKHHRACSSEFDYIGWEKVGVWREPSTISVYPDIRARNNEKNCAENCVYPSACQWKTKGYRGASASVPDLRAQGHDMPAEASRPSGRVRRTVSFDCLPSSCIDDDDDSPPELETETVKKSATKGSASTYLNRLVRAAEKTTSQVSTLLSPIDGDGPGRGNSLRSHPPTQTTPVPRLPEFKSIREKGVDEMIVDTDLGGVVSPLSECFEDESEVESEEEEEEISSDEEGDVRMVDSSEDNIEDNDQDEDVNGFPRLTRVPFNVR